MVGQMEMARRRIAVWSCYPRAHAIMHPATIKVTDMPPEGARSNSLRRPRARNELNGATYGRAMSSIVLPEGAQFDVCYLQARTVKDVLYLWTHSLKSKDKRLFPFLNPLCWVYILGTDDLGLVRSNVFLLWPDDIEHCLVPPFLESLRVCLVFPGSSPFLMIWEQTSSKSYIGHWLEVDFF